MARPRSRMIGWTYDDKRQEIHTPSGHAITLHDVAQMLYDQVVCHHDFKGAWSGWRMRGDQLYPPGHKRGAGCIKPTSWPAWRAHLDDLDQRDLAAVGLDTSRNTLRSLAAFQRIGRSA